MDDLTLTINHHGHKQYVDLNDQYVCPSCGHEYTNTGEGVLCERCGSEADLQQQLDNQ